VTGTAVALLVIAGVIAVADWIAVARDNDPLEYAAKPLTMVALVAAALAAHPELHNQRSWFVAALVLSMAGDVFLMLPANLFVPGLASFLLAHLAYVAGLRLEQHSQAAVTATLFAMAVVGVVIGSRVVTALRAGPHRALQGPVIGYMVVISAMVATALATGDAVASAAALLFYTSDGLIAEQRFVRERAWQPLAIIVTYHVAQLLFVVSLVQ